MENKKNKIVEQEEAILKFWEENKVFQKTLAQDAPKGDYVFYDGPPFATGTPHYGHIVASVMKDAVPRYWTMNGYHVERKWGWDCHGLPIENIVEKEMNISSKLEIEKLGVKKFNESCRSKVLMYADEWKKFIPRIGRWVDMEHPYQTMDTDFMESIWWVFKQLWDKGLVYEGRRSMHICPRCETTLSQSEVSQGYKDVTDLSVIAKFKLLDEENTYVLAWTTTPWTLPGNIALAVGEEIIYAKIKIEKNYYILAKNLIEKVIKDQAYELVQEFEGQKLFGKSYEPLFPYFDLPKNKETGFKIYTAEFVETQEGTGIVHIACGFGADDLTLVEKYNLPFIQHVNISGHFIEELTDFNQEAVKSADDPQATDIKIIKWLASHDKLFHKEKYQHSYPHCWRCDSPLLNYTTSSWFIKVEKIKERMLEIAKQINWTPEHIKEGRFGKWLDGARDWSISRQRYWGSVMPVWKCDKCDALHVFGSIAELEEKVAIKINDLHKENIDPIKFKCDKCDGIMERIPDVLDCWFESGSMPYAQMHYPFENKEKFEKNFPAEFIAEGVDQTRCWFYYLLVLSTGVMDNIAFKNVIANGIVLAEDGQKMSKRLKNYPDPAAVIEKYGADALRYYLLTSPVMKADTLLFAEKSVDEVYKKLIMILNNVVSFYKMYEQSEITASTDSDNVLDQWIIAKLNKLLKEVTEQMNHYDLVQATRPIVEFVDELSTWYLRRSRTRFKSEDQNDKNQALATMKFVLVTLAKILAPFTPFTAESLYQNIDKSKLSVHLEQWPKFDDKLINEDTITNMLTVRELVEKGLSMREDAKIKVRQPLNKIIFQKIALSNNYFELIKDELNVKEVIFGDKDELDVVITPELQEEGLVRELVRAFNAIRKKQKLTINDTVKIVYQTKDQDLLNVLQKYNDELKASTLSASIELGDATEKVMINDTEILIKIDVV